MKKIISLFKRNYETDHLVRDEVVPGAEWVLAGEGEATRKFNGTACLVRDSYLYKRYELRGDKVPPPQFEAAQDRDPITGDTPGWVPVGPGPDDRWHRAAMSVAKEMFGKVLDGTYELCGPKIQGNPEGFGQHLLIRHGAEILPDCPRDFAGIREYLCTRTIEGIVWHRENGEMVKIKRKDFFKFV